MVCLSSPYHFKFFKGCLPQIRFNSQLGLLLYLALTLKDTFITESCIEIKVELNFYFHTSLWCLKRFYQGLKCLHNFL